MGRAFYKITSDTDRVNFLAYLEKHRDAVLSDLRASFLVSSEVILKEKEFLSLWKKISFSSYSMDYPLDDVYHDSTLLLYMLPRSRVDTIKISLRAKLYRNKHKNKSQLTIDKDVYSELSSFASGLGLTLSDAIAALLANDRSFITADEIEDSKNLSLPSVIDK